MLFCQHIPVFELPDRPEHMLTLSEILLRDGDNAASFADLKAIVQRYAVETGSIFFQVDIEPPGYSDRPEDWHDQLEIAFSSAR